MRVTVIAIPRGLHRKLRSIARAEGLVLTEQVRQALVAWVERRERKGRDK